MGLLKRKKIAYYYDTDDCNYHKAGFDWKIFGWRFMSYGLVSVVLCSGLGAECDGGKRDR